MAMPYAYFEGENQNESSRPTTMTKSNGRSNLPPRSQAATAAKLEPVEAEANQSQGSAIPAERKQAVSAKAKAATEAAERSKKRAERLAELEAKRDNLIDRLDMGAVRIQEARAEGKDVATWEDFWLQLLRSYEQVCDELRDLVLAQ